MDKLTKTPPRLDVGDGLLTIDDLLELMRLRSRTTVYARLKSDPRFPRPRRVGARSTVWVRREVIEYLRNLPAVELGAQAQGAAA